jgi:hypothetical protein
MYPFCTRVGLDLRRRGRDALPAGTPMRRAGRESMKSVRAGADGVGDDARPNGVGWLFAPNTPMHAPAAMTGPPPRGRLWRCPGATWTSPATPPRVRTTPIVLNVAWRLSSLSERFTHDDDADFAGRAAGHLDASALRRRYTAALRRGASPAALSSSWAAFFKLERPVTCMRRARRPTRRCWREGLLPCGVRLRRRADRTARGPPANPARTTLRAAGRQPY